MGNTQLFLYPHQSLIGALIYATITRTDISMLLGVLVVTTKTHKFLILLLPKESFATSKALSEMEFTFTTQVSWHSPHIQMQTMFGATTLAGPSPAF